MKLAAPVNLSQLINLLVKEGGEHWLPALTAENVRVAVNQELIVGEVTVGDADEIAFFPTGNRRIKVGLSTRVIIQDQPFDLSAEYQLLKSTSLEVGALAIFVGTVRDLNDGDDVAGLSWNTILG